MKLAWLRSFLWRQKSWHKRSCDTCFCSAVVWCVEHVQYVCEHCIELHCAQARQYGLGQCHFRSVTDMLNPARAERIHKVPERAKAGFP